MKKILVFTLTAAIAAFALSACGSDPAESQGSDNSQPSSVVTESAAVESGAFNLGDIVSAVEQANPVSNPRDIDDNYVSLDMLLTAENIAEYSGKVSNDQDNSAMILAIKAVEGKASSVKTELEAYKSSISSGGMYVEFADMEAMAKDARIVEKGDYVVMVIANTKGADYAEIDKALDSALQ